MLWPFLLCSKVCLLAMKIQFCTHCCRLKRVLKKIEQTHFLWQIIHLKHLLLPVLKTWPLAGSWLLSRHPVQVEMLPLQANWWRFWDISIDYVVQPSAVLQSCWPYFCRPVDWICLHLTAYIMRRINEHSRMWATTLGRPFQHLVKWCNSQCTIRFMPPTPSPQPAMCRWRRWHSSSKLSCSNSSIWWWWQVNKFITNTRPIRSRTRICTPVSALMAQGCSSMQATHSQEPGCCSAATKSAVLFLAVHDWWLCAAVNERLPLQIGCEKDREILWSRYKDFMKRVRIFPV